MVEQEEEDKKPTRRSVTVKLSEEDMDAFADKLAVAVVEQLTSRLQRNVGKGFLDMMWKTFIAACVVFWLYFNVKK